MNNGLRLTVAILCTSASAGNGFAAESGDTPGWRFHGATRVAVGWLDTSSAAAGSFSTGDTFLNFSVRAKSYQMVTELEAGSAQISSQAATSLVGIRQAYIGFTPGSRKLQLRTGRVTLSGATRVGTEAVTRRNDEAFGRIDGLRVDYTAIQDAVSAGLVVGNTLGLYGASSNMVDSALSVDTTEPTRLNAPKASRAAAAYSNTCWRGFCLEAWYAQEKDHFTKAPDVVQENVGGDANPDGVVYKRMQQVDAGMRYTMDKLNFGGWFRKRWLKDPEEAAVGNGGQITRTENFVGKSQWQETFGIGCEYAAAGFASLKDPAAPATWFTGISYVAAQTATEGLAKDGEAAKAEDAKDLKQIGLSLGWRDLPVTMSLNILHSMTEGDTFYNKDGVAEASDRRTVAYTALSFVL